MRSVSASMLRDLLLCERRLALDLHGVQSRREETSAFVQMLWRDGLAHEADILAALPGPVADLRALDRADREIATSIAVSDEVPTILGAVITCADLVGMPDIMRWTSRGHIALDVKAGAALEGPRQTYKPTYLAQVSHYAHILAATGMGRGDISGIVDRDGNETIYDLNLPLGRAGTTGAERHLDLLSDARLIRDGGRDTTGAMCAMCAMCDWRAVCREDLRDTDDLTQLAGLGRAIRELVRPVATTVTELARLEPAGRPALPGIGDERLDRFVQRARLWADMASGPVAYAPIALGPNAHSIDFDVEADPTRGIVYLHGFWHNRADTDGEFVHFFAPTIDDAGERSAFADAVAHFRRHRDAQWFHYSSYEKTAYKVLQRRHPSVCDEGDIDEIFAQERCTDLYKVIAADTDWPLSSYGLKSVARACGFSWSDLDPGGANSIQWFDDFARTGDEMLRERIIIYNRDDVRASAVVRNALVELGETGRIAAFQRPSK